MAKSVMVLGSLNLDIHIPLTHIPTQGETIGLDDASSQAAGGKGANQAVAAQRLGAQVIFVGSVGADEAGRLLVTKCQNEGIDVSSINTLAGENTGQAFIILEPDGHNTIMVEGGANKLVKVDLIKSLTERISQVQILVAQLETNLAPIIEAFTIARSKGVLTILNPAPANEPIPDSLLQLTDVIIPNETEAQYITGLAANSETDFAIITDYFNNKGIKNVLITLGSKGVYYSVNHEKGILPAYKVQAIDTTAAGDTFIGALAAQLQPNLANLKTAIKFANMASSLTVQKSGALDSIPMEAEVVALISKEGGLVG